MPLTENSIAKGVDVIIVILNNPAAIESALKKANERGLYECTRKVLTNSKI